MVIERKAIQPIKISRKSCGLTQRVGRPGAGPDKATARQQAEQDKDKDREKLKELSRETKT